MLILDGNSAGTGRDVAALGIRQGAAPRRCRTITAMLSIYEGQPFLSRLMLDAARWYLSRTVVALQDSFDVRDRTSWPTLSRVQQTLRELGLASPRRVNDMVARLVHTGFVTAVPLPCDRRVRMLTPTARMLAHQRAVAEALDGPVEPWRSAAGRTPRAPGRAGLGAVLRSAQALRDNVPMSFFLERESGIAVLMALLRRGEGDLDPVCFSELGRGFGVSRTHVRLLLREAAHRGHLDEAGGRFSVSPPTMASFDQFLADERAALPGRHRASRLDGAAA